MVLQIGCLSCIQPTWVQSWHIIWFPSFAKNDFLSSKPGVWPQNQTKHQNQHVIVWILAGVLGNKCCRNSYQTPFLEFQRCFVVGGGAHWAVLRPYSWLFAHSWWGLGIEPGQLHVIQVPSKLYCLSCSYSFISLPYLLVVGDERLISVVCLEVTLKF